MKKLPMPGLNPEPLTHCKLLDRGNCNYPICTCYDSDTISSKEADMLLLQSLEPMLSRLRQSLDILKELITKRADYIPYSQLKVYRKRRARLQKNFIFWKIKYDLIKHNQK